MFVDRGHRHFEKSTQYKAFCLPNLAPLISITQAGFAEPATKHALGSQLRWLPPAPPRKQGSPLPSPWPILLAAAAAPSGSAGGGLAEASLIFSSVHEWLTKQGGEGA